MSYPDEAQCREIAQQIERRQPGWMVVWGCYSRRFVAFPLFPAAPGSIITAHYPEALAARLQEFERACRRTRARHRPP
jgi:hypothetical protein